MSISFLLPCSLSTSIHTQRLPSLLLFLPSLCLFHLFSPSFSLSFPFFSTIHRHHHRHSLSFFHTSILPFILRPFPLTFFLHLPSLTQTRTPTHTNTTITIKRIISANAVTHTTVLVPLFTPVSRLLLDNHTRCPSLGFTPNRVHIHDYHHSLSPQRKEEGLQALLGRQHIQHPTHNGLLPHRSHPYPAQQHLQLQRPRRPIHRQSSSTLWSDPPSTQTGLWHRSRPLLLHLRPHRLLHQKSKNNNSGSLPPSPTETVGNSVELLPTQLSSKPKTFQNINNTNAQSDKISTGSCDGRQTQIIQPLLHSLQSFLPESTSSSTRLGFWANLKAHYLAAKATSISWPGAGSGNDNVRSNNGSSQADDTFSPPIALRLSNSTPVAAVDATAPQSASLTLTDMLLSLPNVAAPSTHAYRGSMNYPVSVAAMDKFKPIRSDTIPLKTFTYNETPVIERLPVLTHIVKSPLRKTKESTPSATAGSLSPSSPSSLPVTKNTKSGTTSKGNSRTQDSSLLPSLPRHLAARETRSNAAYLRMMAAELRMIRARKLISPLKPRGYLPRRKEPFQAGMFFHALVFLIFKCFALLHPREGNLLCLCMALFMPISSLHTSSPSSLCLSLSLSLSVPLPATLSPALTSYSSKKAKTRKEDRGRKQGRVLLFPLFTPLYFTPLILEVEWDE
ncbi:MAG: hypothetical protein JOS17DRAFT_204701 [Linnemannia elongata]|nr:MAG: hypothetical protein JOS17DRAFT_204701 [Linnemannia elongata]